MCSMTIWRVIQHNRYYVELIANSTDTRAILMGLFRALSFQKAMKRARRFGVSLRFTHNARAALLLKTIRTP